MSRAAQERSTKSSLHLNLYKQSLCCLQLCNWNISHSDIQIIETQLLELCGNIFSFSQATQVFVLAQMWVIFYIQLLQCQNPTVESVSYFLGVVEFSEEVVSGYI